MSAVPGEKPLQIEGEPTSRGAQCKELCCTPSPKCGLLWCCLTPIIILVILIIVGTSWLDVESKNPPELVAPPESDPAPEMGFNLVFASDSAATTFEDGLDDSSSDIYSTLKDAINGKLDGGVEVDDDGRKADGRRRRALLGTAGEAAASASAGAGPHADAAPRRRLDTKVGVTVTLKAKDGADDAEFDQAEDDLLTGLNADSGLVDEWAEVLQAAVVEALDAAGLPNVTVSAEDVEGRDRFTYYVCTVEAPFANRLCGGALNAAIRQSPRVKETLQTVVGECDFGDAAPAAYYATPDQLVMAGSCKAPGIGLPSYECRLQKTFNDEAEKIGELAQENGASNCALQNPVKCAVYRAGRQWDGSKRCATRGDWIGRCQPQARRDGEQKLRCVWSST